MCVTSHESPVGVRFSCLTPNFGLPSVLQSSVFARRSADKFAIWSFSELSSPMYRLVEPEFDEGTVFTLPFFLLSLG